MEMKSTKKIKIELRIDEPINSKRFLNEIAELIQKGVAMKSRTDYFGSYFYEMNYAPNENFRVEKINGVKCLIFKSKI